MTIKRETTMKFLGILLDENLTWKLFRKKDIKI